VAASGPAKFVVSGPAARQRVALTFHTDGDLTLAQQYLDVFASHNVHVTCFIVGKWLDANQSWAAKLTDAGHELANHTYNHLTFGQLPPQQMTDEIVRCRDLLVRLTGKPGRYFRPSGTDDGTSTPPAAVLQAAGAAGYSTVLGFDVDPLDYSDPGSAAVTQRTLATVKPGSIVSLHFGHPGTLAALPGILDGLAQHNLVPVTASELLA
jgi:peptidoglycan/xylan/chitin deacetylase (PgdA/CDA1 family)